MNRIRDRDRKLPGQLPGQLPVQLPPLLPVTAPAFRAVNVNTESPNSLRAAGFGQDPREYWAVIGVPDGNRQRAQSPKSDRVAEEHSGSESSTLQASNPSARESSPIDNRRGGEDGTRCLFRPAQPAMVQDGCGNLLINKCSTASPTATGIPPSQGCELPLLETSGSCGDQEERSPPTRNTSLPSIAELIDPAQLARWRSWSLHPLAGVMPDVHESRSLEMQTVVVQSPPHEVEELRFAQGVTHPEVRNVVVQSRPREVEELRFVQGATQPLGPPMKPFDDERSETIAQEQWRLVKGEERCAARSCNSVTAQEEFGDVGGEKYHQLGNRIDHHG